MPLQPIRGAAGALLLAWALSWHQASAAQGAASFSAVRVNSSIPWTYCGYYGYGYSVTCTAPVDTYISTAIQCGSGSSGYLCPIEAQYANVSCFASKWCFGQAYKPQSKSLCLVLKANATVALNSTCDLSLTYQDDPITDDSSNSWPSWQIFAVAAAAAGGLVLLCGLMMCACWWCCCRRSWDVAPSPTPLADDPYDMSAVARQKRENLALLEAGTKIATPGLMPSWHVDKPAAFPPIRPTKEGSVYSPQPNAAPLSHMVVYPPQYMNTQRRTSKGTV